MTDKSKKLTFSTMEGCKKILAILVAIILLSSFFAYMLASDWGKLKINDISFDSRGSVMQATLYTPRIVSVDDKLPAILVTHGMSCTKSTVNGIAEEFARRGFVVLSVSAYGAGTSETLNGSDPTGGIYDALNYMRTLQYVDTTRIALIGHSQGSQRIAAVADQDCSPFTLNDLMINVLHDTFGQEFTYEEISLDADKLAKDRLSKDQLVYYDALKVEKEKYLDNTVYAILVLGGNWGLNEKKVMVGGYEVTRVPNCNACWQIALFNEGRAGTGQKNLTNESMLERFQVTDAIKKDTWYQVKTYTNETRPTSAVLGTINDTSVATNTTLQTALKNRSTRIFFTTFNSHARDYFSRDAASHMVQYFEQALSYNRGEMTDATTVPLEASNIHFMFREFLNLIAFISMCLALVAFSGILMRTKYFAPCKQETCEPFVSKKNSVFWIISLIYILIAFLAIRFVTQNGPALGFKSIWVKKFWSMDFTADIHIVFMWLIAIGSFVLLTIFTVYNYKKKNLNIPKELRLITKPQIVLKYVLMAAILFLGAYISLATIKYLFHQDYRFWDTGVKDMPPQYFMLCLRYAILILPTFIIGGLFVNAGRMKDMSDGWNTVLQMVLSCLGLYIACFISYGACYITYWQTGVGIMPSMALISTWPMLINIPLFALLGRKFYTQTGSIWLGALVNTAIACWMICSAQSSTTFYLLGSFSAKWLGIF
ncbi:alpha/beta hydrolase [uncultured Sphaerochaeta sp.]|uniref:alpha/beta hydrolase n=1 Tax=uncultured Sphaerochaeta sp. TaxID=886478 RepID=UPI002A0A7C56|nr:alpha/beta hydrolase [uncultured Sphaerochaeta sp.]